MKSFLLGGLIALSLSGPVEAQFRFSTKLEKLDLFNLTRPSTFAGHPQKAYDFDRDGRIEVVYPSPALVLWGGSKIADERSFDVYSIDMKGGMVRRLDLMPPKSGRLPMGSIGFEHADFNGDGWEDIFYIDLGLGPRLFLFSPKKKTFILAPMKIAYPKLFSGTKFFSRFELHDFNSDGVSDILSALPDNGLLLYLSQKKNGEVSWVNVSRKNLPLPPKSLVLPVVLADFDGDGDQDAFVGRHLNTDIVLENLGGGRFRYWPYPTPPTSLSTLSAAVGDVNGDNLPDILIGHQPDSSGKSCPQPHVWINLGKKGFKVVPLNLPRKCCSDSMESFLVDLDQDGDLDAIASSYYANCGTLFYENDGRGNFRLVDPIGPPINQSGKDWGIVPLDFDGDGDTDLMMRKSYVFPFPLIWRNLKRQLHTPKGPRIGRPFEIEVWSQDPPAFFYVFFSFQEMKIPLKSGEVWWLNPLTMARGPLILLIRGMPDPYHRKFSFPFPNLPQLIGKTLYTQAVVYTPTTEDRVHVTGVMVDRIW